jgi:hypothetical protein
MADFLFQRGKPLDISGDRSHHDNRRNPSGQITSLTRRSAKYVKLMCSLDETSLATVQGWQQLMHDVQEEFGDAGLASLPLGIVAKCFLGKAFEVHTIDLTGSQIIEHYKSGESMPGGLDRARALAMHNAYAFVEVYTDKLVLITEDGSTTLL